MSKKDRLSKFASRHRFDPSNTRELGCAGRYITINPMADETDLLLALCMNPSDCIKVDLYWEHAGDVAFVQLHTKAYSESLLPGIYARVNPEGRANFVVVVQYETISTETTNEVLRRLASINWADVDLSESLKKVE